MPTMDVTLVPPTSPPVPYFVLKSNLVGEGSVYVLASTNGCLVLTHQSSNHPLLGAGEFYWDNSPFHLDVALAFGRCTHTGQKLSGAVVEGCSAAPLTHQLLAPAWENKSTASHPFTHLLVSCHWAREAVEWAAHPCLPPSPAGTTHGGTGTSLSSLEQPPSLFAGLGGQPSPSPPWPSSQRKAGRQVSDGEGGGGGSALLCRQATGVPVEEVSPPQCRQER